MAKTVKNIDGITRPFYDRNPNDRRHFADIPRFNEYPPPTTKIIDPCGKVNELWRPHINGMLSILVDEDLWQGSPSDKTRAVQLMYFLMEWLYQCDKDEDMQLRPSASDPCIMEQFVGGEWILAFDFGACMAKMSQAVPTDVITDNATPIVEASLDAYDAIETNTLAVEYPNAVNSPSDPLNSPKNTMLCATLTDYINKLADFIQAMAQRASEETTQPNLGQMLVDWGTTIGTGVSLGVSIFFPLAGAPLWLLNMGRIGAGASFLYSSARTANTTNTFVRDVKNAFFDEGISPIVIDDARRKEIICTLYENLKDKPLTQANFESAVADLPEATTVEQAIKNAITWMFLTNVSYAEFVMVYNQVFIASQTGIEFTDSECGCVTEWVHEFDFRSSDNEFVERLTGASVRVGDKGWISSGSIFVTTKEAGCKRDNIPLLDSVLTSVTIYWQTILPKAGWTWILNVGSNSFILPSGTGEQAYTGIGEWIGDVDISAFIHFASSGANDSQQIQMITLRGVGDNPFA